MLMWYCISAAVNITTPQFVISSAKVVKVRVDDSLAHGHYQSEFSAAVKTTHHQCQLKCELMMAVRILVVAADSWPVGGPTSTGSKCTWCPS